MKIAKTLLCILMAAVLVPSWTKANAADAVLTKETAVALTNAEKPASVNDLKTEVKGINSVKLTWSVVDSADGYIIYRRIGNGKFEYRYMVSGTSYTDTTAQAGEFNFYRVYAYKNINGKRVLSESGNYAYAKTAPAAITTLKAQATGISSVKLTWNKVANADGYIIYRRIGDGKFEYRYMVSGTSYTDTTAHTGEYNFYRVYAYNNVNGKRIIGTSDNYAYAMPKPLAVTNLKAHKLGVLTEKLDIKLTWDKVKGADGYIIYRKGPHDTKMTYYSMVSDINFIDTAIKGNQGYNYRVYAYRNANGKRVLSPPSAWISVYVFESYIDGKVILS